MNWSIIANRFRTVIKFANQTELALFLVEVAKLADQMDHHPDLTIRHCCELSISVYSHDQQKIVRKLENQKEEVTIWSETILCFLFCSAFFFTAKMRRSQSFNQLTAYAIIVILIFFSRSTKGFFAGNCL